MPLALRGGCGNCYLDVLGIDEKDEEGNIVASVGNVHVQ
jgi:hypothetical protein